MCGIVGYVGNRQAQDIIVEGLRKLEYRGYDSAGVATLLDGRTHVRRAVGKLSNLANLLKETPLVGTTGVGHTRWATHGRPSEENAHPHTADGVTVVHNGIIENHLALRDELRKAGRVFKSETDTEIFAHLVALESARGLSLADAVRAAAARVHGAFALVVMREDSPGVLVGVKVASPLVVGIGDDEAFLASDVPAILAHTRRVIFLEEGDMAVITPQKVTLTTLRGEPVDRPVRVIDWTPVMAEKGGHKHFMHKEIFEQPRAVADTLRGRVGREEGQVFLDGVKVEELKSIKRVVVLACGTSWHAGLVGKALIEQFAHVPVDVELASEFRYREPIVEPGTLALAISQSGETADTLAALKEARNLGARVMAICNVLGSAIAREAEKDLGVLYTHAGPEIGVASTKAFVTQIVALHLMALGMGRARGHLDAQAVRTELQALSRLPKLMESVLDDDAQIAAIARTMLGTRDTLFLGRGMCFPIALEGALKLKEISYIHAEGYAAGEMKHGPIALIEHDLPVICLVTQGNGYDKMLGNIQEVRARGGRVIAIATDGDKQIGSLAQDVIYIPQCPRFLEPALAALPCQLLAYHVADGRGTDVDQPRNLAKSVTVE
ncbi:MAG: glutamine--fructose-6-phosphate transaminase (isomerizing) [Deltaproteobacteria bacterium]|nr:glutamine--fructose-6-phosphate transaminase (isomerizing) [Deltaproteobacteria bacterium]